MADKKDTKAAPDIESKLNAPKKISLFERQRQEAENKRLREEAETERALKEFEDSFANDAEEEDDFVSRIASGRGFQNDVPTGPKGAGLGSAVPRHYPFSTGQRSAGPGSLGPPPSLKRKFGDTRDDRSRLGGLDGAGPSSVRRSASGSRNERRGTVTLGDDDEDDDELERRRRKSPETTVRKPTMLLSSLPPDIKSGVLEGLVSTSLKVDNVEFIYPRSTNQQRTRSALVTLTADTPISDVDKLVTELQNRYLGFGYYLNISRHVSTTGSGGPNIKSIATTEIEPFGAKRPPVQMQAMTSLHNAPPPVSLGNHPPPNAYAPSGPGQMHQGQNHNRLQVNVCPPTDIKLLKTIHRTAEQLITHGAEYEALLMSRPEVQHDERWAWLYDPTSQGGVYYRWLIWKYYSEDSTNWDDEAWAHANVSHGPFESGPQWIAPLENPRYEHVTEFEDFVEDDEYMSSEDESGDEGVARQFATGSAPGALEDGPDSTHARYLNPYRRAKLTYLLSRLPEAIAMLRTGDVARVTNFVVNNAGQGAEEIVDMLISNVEHPYRLCVSYDADDLGADQDVIDDNDGEKGGKKDNSNSKLIGLYLISDALQASSTSGVRDAWKYRTLFEQALTARKTFEHLGRMEKEMQWGRMKAEQWKRKVGIVLGLWEQWSVFPSEVQEIYKKSFNEPPLTEEELVLKDEEERKEKEEKEKSMWKTRDAPSHDEKKTHVQDLEEKPEQKETLAPTAAEQQTVRPGRKRPTAADLIGSSESDSLPQNVPSTKGQSQAAPLMKMGGFGFSMSLGVRPADPAAVQTSSEEIPAVQGREDMFDDSEKE